MRRVWKRVLAGAGVVVAAGVAWAAWPDDLFYAQLQPAASAPAANIVVGPNVHVSKAHEKHPFTECILAADPNRPGRLFAASMYWPHAAGTSLVGYLSDDGGATWTTSLDLVADKARKERLADPTAAFGPDGELYFVHMRVESRPLAPGVVNTLGVEGAGALDWLALPAGGATNWELRSRVDRHIDRPWLAVDHTAGPHRGRLYCSANIDAPYFLTSADGGRTVTTPAVPYRHRVNPYSTQPVVLSDGTVLTAFRCSRHRSNVLDPQQTPLFRTADGGRSLAQAGDVNIYWKHPAYGPIMGNTEGYTPGLAADPGSPGRADALYYVWAQRFHPRPDTERVLFTRSTDRGETWSDPVVLSEQADDPDSAADYVAYMPCVAVNKAGVVAVTWYDRRGLPPQATPKTGPFPPMKGWNVRMRASLDGGATWPPSVLVNAVPSTGELAGWHTAGLAADAAGRFHPAWTDDRTGRPQLWTATVEVTP